MVVYEQSIEAETPVTVSDRLNKVYIYYGAQEKQESTYPGWGNYDDPDYVNPGVTIIG